jgi:predicted nucleic acid-binding protein
VIVIDASASAHYLLATEDRGAWVAERITDDGELHAPHLLDVEVASVVRGLVRGGIITAARGRATLSDLREFDVARYPHLPLLERIWKLRGNLGAYDAAYVALAQVLRAPLLTTDERIARTPRLGIRLLTP